MSDLAKTASVELTAGTLKYQPSSNTIGSWGYCDPWPYTARPVVYPTVQTYVIPAPIVEEQYANEVEITRGEHDAVLRFYRKHSRSRVLVKEITVPNGLLAFMEASA